MRLFIYFLLQVHNEFGNQKAKVDTMLKISILRVIHMTGKGKYISFISNGFIRMKEISMCLSFIVTWELPILCYTPPEF